MHITLVAGTRPNFVKISPIIQSIRKNQDEGVNVDFTLVHTGQHYDSKMSSSFFEDLKIPLPGINLNVGSGTQAEQTAAIMIGFEKMLMENQTDLVLVVGDVTSTMACSIVAKKLNIKLAHVEGGIRSFDSSMPEEINRKVTDSITDYFFTTSVFANQNLLKEGIDPESIFFVGNVMIDTLVSHRNFFRKPSFFDELGISHKKYLVLTLHRPSNVDNTSHLMQVIREIAQNSHGLKVIFPAHPRTSVHLNRGEELPANIYVVEPMGYLEFNYLVENSYAVITDSGGITEETTFMGIPCLTMRDNTERPETCSVGTNKLVGSDPGKLKPALDELFSSPGVKGGIPELWDGKSADRIISTLVKIMSR